MSDEYGLRPRDRLLILNLALQYDEQLAAIRAVLALHRKASQALESERLSIEAAMTRLEGNAFDRAQDDWGLNFYSSVYAEASYSVGALVMIAPFVEALFHQVYMAIASQPSPSKLAGAHERWQSGDDRQWDCHFVFRRGRFYKDLVPGVIQIADAIGLSEHLHDDLPARLAALFAYRNKMFHHGLEWPLPQRLAFQQQVDTWPAHWFKKAESDHKPWIFYLSQSFLDEFIALINLTLDSMGTFIKEKRIGVVTVPDPLAH